MSLEAVLDAVGVRVREEMQAYALTSIQTPPVGSQTLQVVTSSSSAPSSTAAVVLGELLCYLLNVGWLVCQTVLRC